MPKGWEYRTPRWRATTPWRAGLEKGVVEGAKEEGMKEEVRPGMVVEWKDGVGRGLVNVIAECMVETMVWMMRMKVGRMAYVAGRMSERRAWAVAPTRRRVRRVKQSLIKEAPELLKRGNRSFRGSKIGLISDDAIVKVLVSMQRIKTNESRHQSTKPGKRTSKK